MSDVGVSDGGVRLVLGVSVGSPVGVSVVVLVPDWSPGKMALIILFTTALTNEPILSLGVSLAVAVESFDGNVPSIVAVTNVELLRFDEIDDEPVGTINDVLAAIISGVIVVVLLTRVK